MDQSGKESGSIRSGKRINPIRIDSLETLAFSEAQSKVCNMLEYYSLFVQMRSFTMFFPHPEQLKYEKPVQ